MATGSYLEVQRDDLRNRRLVAADLPDLLPGQALLSIDSFGLSANNVTYGVNGESMAYWRFFPSSESGWGRIPVWGFASVAASRVDGLPVGARVYGFLPFGSHLVVQPDRLSERGFLDGMAHRRDLPRLYNGYQFAANDPVHPPEAEDVRAVFFPLFATSFLLDDFLSDNADFGAEQIVFSSASAKTAVGVALCARRRDGRQPRLVGLTSQANAAYVAGLGLYDQVLTYPEIESMPPVSTVYVDLAGNGDVRRQIHERFGDHLRYSCQVGFAHWESSPASGQLPGPDPTFFFAPAQASKRIGEWGAAGYQERFADAWGDLVDGVRERFTFTTVTGLPGAARVFGELVAGSSRPEQAYLVSMLEVPR